jgi:hypothetical protein
LDHLVAYLGLPIDLEEVVAGLTVAVVTPIFIREWDQQSHRVMIPQLTLPMRIPWHVTRSIIIITNSPFSLKLLLLLSMHHLLLLRLFLIVGRIGEQIVTVFLGVCWKPMNGVDSDLDLDL